MSKLFLNTVRTENWKRDVMLLDVAVSKNSLSPFKEMKNASLRGPSGSIAVLSGAAGCLKHQYAHNYLLLVPTEPHYFLFLLNMYFYERHRFLQEKMVFHIEWRAFLKRLIIRRKYL